MKAKTQVTLFILLTGLMVSGIVYGDDPLKGSTSDTMTTGSGSNLGWQEHTGRQIVYINDGLHLSTGFSVGTGGYTLNMNISSTFDRIECCQWTTLKQSWCNYNADDPKCLD